MQVLRSIFTHIGQMGLLTYYIWKSILIFSILSLLLALVFLYTMESGNLGLYELYRCTLELSELPKAYILMGIFLTPLTETYGK